MNKLNLAAMEEAARNSKCLVAIVTGAENEGDPEDSAYLRRDFCLRELRWARDAGVPIQPVYNREDKHRIGEFVGQLPEDLRDLGNVNFLPLDRISPATWQTSVDELNSSIAELTGDVAHERMCKQCGKKQASPLPVPWENMCTTCKAR